MRAVQRLVVGVGIKRRQKGRNTLQLPSRANLFDASTQEVFAAWTS